ncbi:TPA: hypothetical protein NIB58_004662 [Pseudomonas aeruginosa]|nr:hypothetical protein [Pseudomonas aeruginosa]HCF2913592.1 hypothetical protein [Pseudomonas aeruginosa]
MTRLKMRGSLLAAAIACAIIQPAMAIDGFVEKRTGDPLVDKLIQSNHPLTSEQQLKLRAYQQNDAKALELKTPSDATRNSPMSVIDLTQGAPAKQVVLQQGYAATLMVVGENGSPWPIERVTSGDKGIVEPVTLESRKTAVELTPIAPWASTNLFVYLAGREEPIKLYARVSADPAEGLNDAIKVIIDGVPPGSSPLLQANRMPVDDKLMNSLGQGPGRNWIELAANQNEMLPFRINYWMSPDRKTSIVRLRNAQLVSPDWDGEYRDTDGVVRVYRYERVPLMLRIRDTDGIEHQVRVDNPADLLAGRETSKSLSVKNVTPERPPLTKPLDWEAPVGLVGRDRTQTVMRTGTPADDLHSQYVEFDGQGKRAPKIQIVSELGMNRDIAKQLIADAYTKRPALPATPSASKAPPTNQSFETAKASAAPSTPPLTATTTSLPGKPPVEVSSLLGPTKTAPQVATAPVPTGYSMSVTAGGLYENLFRFTEKAGWKPPIWDLSGTEDFRIVGGYTVSGSSPEEVIQKYLEPYMDSYNFHVEISTGEKAVWIH